MSQENELGAQTTGEGSEYPAENCEHEMVLACKHCGHTRFEKAPQANTTPGPSIFDPVARTLADMVTTKQLGMIRAVAREVGVDADEECANLLGCLVTELSRRGASKLIDRLRELQEKKRGVAA